MACLTLLQVDYDNPTAIETLAGAEITVSSMRFWTSNSSSTSSICNRSRTDSSTPTRSTVRSNTAACAAAAAVPDLLVGEHLQVLQVTINLH
jgi:hypothetical protein